MSNRRALGHSRWREGFRETFLVVFTRKGDVELPRFRGHFTLCGNKES
jgi:hypothetical protein